MAGRTGSRGVDHGRGPASGPQLVGQHYDPDADLLALEDHPDNPRVGDDSAVAESIEANGFYGVILAQRSTGRILAGHTRRRQLVAAGAVTGPVLWLDVDHATARRILLADNRTTELASWDEAALAALLGALAGEETGLAGTGFTDADLAALAAELAGPEPPGEFPAVGGEPTDFRCPKCGFEWSGRAR